MADWTRKIQGLGGLGEIGGLAEEVAEPPAFSEREIVVAPAEPGQGGDALEKAALQGVAGTLPERIVWKWLLDERHLFEPQVNLLGGRATRGGAVVDFIVFDLAPSPVALRVQGEYWHGARKPGTQVRDDLQAVRLRARGYLVADLWEQDIYAAVLYGRDFGEYVRAQVVG